MKNIKLIATLVLAFAFLFAQVGNVAAAPLAQDTTFIAGTVTELTCDIDTTNNVTTFLVTVEAADGTSQTVRIDQQTAVDLGLVTEDESSVADCSEEALSQATGMEVDIDPATVIPDETEEEDVHPISALLAEFFDVDASDIDGYHEDGFGFGVIAQALWMSKNVEGEISFEDILQAKKDGSGTFTLNGTEITYTNWGQFKKALRENDLLEKHNNLGNVVSGHAEEDETSTQSLNGNGKGKGNGKGIGNGKGKGHNK